jgi:hypothetical protein
MRYDVDFIVLKMYHLINRDNVIVIDSGKQQSRTFLPKAVSNIDRAFQRRHHN